MGEWQPTIVVTGGRGYRNYAHVKRVLDEERPKLVIQGECPYGGADALAARWRTYENGSLAWTPHLAKAIRYARREDAEMAHSADGEAWVIQPYVMPSAGAKP